MTYRVGIDIGSTATKAVVIDNNNIAFTLVIPTGYSSVQAANQVLKSLAGAGFPLDQCVCVATGYGRVAVPFALKAVTEITCHGKGAGYLFGPDCTVVDIGGQDTKAIVLKGGRVIKFNMNDKCSAGTGKFLEIMANRLGVSQDEMERLARKGQPTTISSMCTVFAESEVISLIGAGTPRENICWGVVESVVAKVKPLVPPASDNSYVLTGGLCENSYVIERLASQLGGEVRTSALARYAGAIGAALSISPDEAKDAIQLGKTCAQAFASECETELAQEACVQAEPTMVVVAFDTTTQALAFEKAAQKLNLPGRLMPVPRTISAGCGYAWCAELEQRGCLEPHATKEACAGIYEV